MGYAQSRVEKSEVLGDFGNRGDGRFTAPAGDSLLDRDSWLDSRKLIQVRPRQLFDKLAGVG